MPENLFFQFQNQKSTKFAEYSQRTYHEVTYLLALGIFVVVGSFGIYKLLGPIKVSEENKRIIIYLIISGVPYMLLSWFGAFLFIFWDFHMSRIYIDYWDKIMATKIYGNPTKYKLLFDDFLGVRNKAKVCKIPAVNILYAAIAIPGILISSITFGISIMYVWTHTKVLKEFIAKYFLFSQPKVVELGNWIIYVPLSVYILGIVILGILMYCSHIKCKSRKEELMDGIAKELNVKT